MGVLGMDLVDNKLLVFHQGPKRRLVRPKRNLRRPTDKRRLVDRWLCTKAILKKIYIYTIEFMKKEPDSDGLQLSSDGLQPTSDGLRPTRRPGGFVQVQDMSSGRLCSTFALDSSGAVIGGGCGNVDYSSILVTWKDGGPELWQLAECTIFMLHALKILKTTGSTGGQQSVGDLCNCSQGRNRGLPQPRAKNCFGGMHNPLMG